MARHVVLLGGSALLAAALRALLHPDDRITQLDEPEEPWELDADVDTVVVDLPVDSQLPVVEKIRGSYRGRLVVMMDPTDDHAAFPAEHDCLVVKRPVDLGQLLTLLTRGPSGRTASVYQPAAAIYPGDQVASEVSWVRLVRHPAGPLGWGRVRAAASGSAGAATVTGVSGRVTVAGTSLLLAYLCVVAASELVWRPIGISVLASAAANGLLALLLCLALRATADARTAALLPPLVAISVVRLVTFAALPADVHPLLRLVVVSVPALVAVAMAARMRLRQWRLLWPRAGGWFGQVLVALLGIPLALLVVAVQPPAVQVSVGASTAVAVTVLALVALPDELLYRGLLVPASVGVAGGWGLPLSSVAYALAYLPGGSPRTVLLAFLLGMVLGWCRQWTGSVVGVVAAHGLLNVLVYLLPPTAGA
jgi:membrane protease YdiL (CAAX protease family)